MIATAFDAAIREVWGKVNVGAVTFDEGARIVEELTARRDRRACAAEPAHPVDPDRGPRKFQLPRGRAKRAGTRGVSAFSVEERRERLVKRKALGAEVFPSWLVAERFHDPEVGAPTDSDRAVAAVVGAVCVMGACTLAIPTIARRAWVGVRTAQTSLAKLQRAGLIASMPRRREPIVHDTNLVVIADPGWRQHLIDLAVVRRIKKKGRVVQYSADERIIEDDDSLAPLQSDRVQFGHDGAGSAEKGASEKEADWGCGAGARHKRRHFDGRDPLGIYWAAAGSILDVSSVALLDGSDLERLLRQGCTVEDILTSIHRIVRRHKAVDWSNRIRSWAYFAAPAIEARDCRLARNAAEAGTVDLDRIMAEARDVVDLTAPATRDVRVWVELAKEGASQTDMLAGVRAIARRRGVHGRCIMSWRYFEGAVLDAMRERRREAGIEADFAAFWSTPWPNKAEREVSTHLVYRQARDHADREELDRELGIVRLGGSRRRPILATTALYRAIRNVRAANRSHGAGGRVDVEIGRRFRTRVPVTRTKFSSAIGRLNSPRRFPCNQTSTTSTECSAKRRIEGGGISLHRKHWRGG